MPDWNFNIDVNSKLIVSDNLFFYGKKDKIHNTNDSIKFSELINYPLILTGAQIVLRQKDTKFTIKLENPRKFDLKLFNEVKKREYVKKITF